LEQVRILMVSSFYHPFLGGEELNIRKLSTALAERGHKVAVATLWHQGLPEHEVDQGVRIYRIRASLRRLPGLLADKDRLHLPPLPDAEASVGLRRVIRRERPQVIHAHNWLVHSLLPIKAWSGARLVRSLHDYSFACANTVLIHNGGFCGGPSPVKCLRCAADYYGPGKGIGIALANGLMHPFERRLVDRFVCVSEAVAIGNGLVRDRLPYQVIHNFIDDDPEGRPSDADALLAQLPSEPFLLFVGAFAAHKGVDVLLRAYADLLGAPPLVMIGYTSDGVPPDLPPNVYAFPNWPHPVVMEAWERCLFGLAPSVWAEPFATVLLEAMVTGRPIIASRTGGTTEAVVDEETGLLVPPGDEVALRQAMARLIADPELRGRMGNAARQRAKVYRSENVLPKYEQLYQELAPQAAAEPNEDDLGRDARSELPV
jgi:glycosyltransferase involved in cell wall biosynthesis